MVDGTAVVPDVDADGFSATIAGFCSGTFVGEIGGGGGGGGSSDDIIACSTSGSGAVKAKKQLDFY